MVDSVLSIIDTLYPYTFRLVYHGVIGYTYIILEEPIVRFVPDIVKLFNVIHYPFMTILFQRRYLVNVLIPIFFLSTVLAPQTLPQLSSVHQEI